MKLPWLPLAVALGLAVVFFVVAVYSSFTILQIKYAKFDPDDLIFANMLAGLAEIFIGYQSMVIFGGNLSLNVAESLTGLTGSKQAIEVVSEDPKGLGQKLFLGAYLIYVPLLVFIVTVAIAWDVYTVDSTQSGVLAHLLGPIDIFSRPIGSSPILYSLHVLPVIMLFGFIAGIVPSISLPYFGGFRVTGVNSGPFHTTLLLYAIGFLAGLSVIFTLLGFLYKVLVLEKVPPYYHYLLVVEIGLALCFAVGSYLGLAVAQKRIRERLASKKGERVFQGTVSLVPSP